MITLMKEFPEGLRNDINSENAIKILDAVFDQAIAAEYKIRIFTTDNDARIFANTISYFKICVAEILELKSLQRAVNGLDDNLQSDISKQKK